MEFNKKLHKAVQSAESILCVGLDPNPARIPDSFKAHFDKPETMVVEFCSQIIDATSAYCCAFKPNLAFFEALGARGLEAFQSVLNQIPDGKIVIADAKRGDIGSTAEFYKKAYFEQFDVDAITLNPLMGFDTLDPFLDRPDKAVYSLVLTSNPGSNDLLLRRFEGRLSLAEYIAGQLSRKSEKSAGHLGMVIGATHSDALEQVLGSYPEASLLIPGIGSQGGSVSDLERSLAAHKGIPLVSSSRSILYAGEGGNKWKDDVAKAAKKTSKELKSITKRFLE